MAKVDASPVALGRQSLEAASCADVREAKHEQMVPQSAFSTPICDGTNVWQLVPAKSVGIIRKKLLSSSDVQTGCKQ